MRLAVFGGSFDPVHIGHLALADAVLTMLPYDRLILIPSFCSPFKTDRKAASPKDRLDMLAASLSGDSRIIIDSCEINRGGISYTIDTLKDIAERYQPAGKLGLVMGDDVAAGFSSWHNSKEISEYVDFIIAHRNSTDDIQFPFPATKLQNDIIRLSSSAVREKIASGGAWHYLVLPACKRIIEDRSLYEKNTSLSKASLNNKRISKELLGRIEQEARSRLSTERFLHSRNTAVLASRLASRSGLDMDAAYFAGIAHDLCKEDSNKQLMDKAGRDLWEISAMEREKPSLLHARAAAQELKERFFIEDSDILDAVREHIFASDSMRPLAKILYIADKIEETRTNVPPGLRARESWDDLDSLFLAVVRFKAACVREKGYRLSEQTEKILMQYGVADKE